MKIALVFVFGAFSCCVSAQVYDVGPSTTKTPQSTPAQKQVPDQQLGFGSNLENARLARGAEIALQHGDHAQALDYARRAAQASPSNPQLWFLVGYAARLNGRYGESAEAYTRGLRLAPTSLEGQSGLAQTYSVMGRGEEAQKILKKVIAEDPRRRDDVVLMGDLYMRAGDFHDAVDSLLSAERMRPDVRSELLLAISYQRLKQPSQATKYLEMAEHRAPNNPEVERSMAGYYRETGNYVKAIAELKAIPSPKPDVIAELAYTYQLDGKLDESAQLYVRAANAVPKDMGLQLSAAQAEIALGSLEKANPFLARASEIDPNYYRLHAILGSVDKNLEHDQDALKEYQTALANMPADPAEGPLYAIQLHMNLMDVDKDLDDAASARHELETAQTEINALGNVQDNRGGFLRLRALIKMNVGDLNGALGDMKEALALNAHDRDDLQLNGDILMKMGQTEAAIKSYKQILDADPRNRGALTSLGYASRVAGRDQEAEKYFARLEQADPTNYVPYLALGDLYTGRRDFSKAQASYDKAYALAPKRGAIEAGGMNAAIEDHNLNIAGTWLSRVTPAMEHDPQILREKERYLSFKGDDAESAAVGEEALKVLPKDRDVVVYLGYDLLHLEKWDELLALTTKYLDAFPKEPDLPLLEGYVHKHQGDSEDAEADFTEALKRDPNVVTAYINRGYTRNDLHEPKPAAADFEAALHSEPNNGEAHLGLAYSNLDLGKPQAALRQADLAEKALGDSRDIHLIRATAYGRQDMLLKAANEYRAALKFSPDDGAIHLGLGNVIFAERKYHEAIAELEIAAKDSPDNAEIYALLARSYANLNQRDPALHYVQEAEHVAEHPAPVPKGHAQPNIESELSQIYVSTGEALDTLGEHEAAMQRFGKALDVPHADRVGVRLAIAQLMAEQDQSDDAERQIALAQLEGEGGETLPPTGSQYIAAADVFRSLHEYQLSQTYLQRAKAAGAPDAAVRIGLANNYLAMGDTARAEAQLAAVSAAADTAPDYQFLLAKANVYRQEHQGALALTSFAQATSAEGEDQAAEQSLLQAGADEGLRVTPKLSLLSDFSMEPIFEDSTVYVLDSKLDATFPVSSSQTSLLPPPRSSLETQNTDASHLHFEHIPTIAGFFQVRNARGEISVPATNSIEDRDTTDWTFNGGVNPTVNLGRNVLQFNLGIQEIVRRDSKTPVALNQNLFRQFAYLSTSSFFNAISVSGYVIHEAGPFTESAEHSSALVGAVDFRVGAPWGKTALVTGWGANDQSFKPVEYEDYFTSSYIGFDRRFKEKWDVRAMIEDVRAWRTVGPNIGIAQNLRPAGTVHYTPNRFWDVQISSAYSNTRSFHVYDQFQNGLSVSYARPFRRKFNDESGTVVLEYPIRFSAGMEQETFYNFKGSSNEQIRPYVRVSFF